MKRSPIIRFGVDGLSALAVNRSAELRIGTIRPLERAEQELGAPSRFRADLRARIRRILAPGIRFAFAAFAGLAVLLPASASACASCFGQSDSPMAKGMNAGIFALLLVITSVLLVIAIFFAYILRRAARLNEATTATAPAAASLASAASPVTQPSH